MSGIPGFNYSLALVVAKLRANPRILFSQIHRWSFDPLPRSNICRPLGRYLLVIEKGGPTTIAIWFSANVGIISTLPNGNAFARNFLKVSDLA